MCAADYARRRVVHLYIGNHRLTESGKAPAPPASAVELLVRRHARYHRKRPDVQLPADVPQRRRCGGDWSTAGKWRLGGAAQEILFARFLGRHCPVRLHAVSVHRRAVPIPAQYTRASTGARPPHSDRLREWTTPRYLGVVSDAVRDSENSRVLRRYRSQFFADRKSVV